MSPLIYLLKSVWVLQRTEAGVSPLLSCRSHQPRWTGLLREAASHGPEPATKLSMKIAVFPLVTERKDDLQGVYSRQLSALLVDGLRRCGADATRRVWFAERGNQRAHIVLEAPLPRDVLLHELEDAGAALALVGRCVITAQQAELELALIDPEQDDPNDAARWTFKKTRPGDEAPLLVNDAVIDLLTWLEEPPCDGAPPNHDLTLHAWTQRLLDADAQELVEAGGLASLAHPDHAWAHLFNAYENARHRICWERELHERIDRWQDDGQHHLSLRALRALCRLHDDHEKDWQSLAALADQLNEEAALEEALNALARCSADTARANLVLGVFLLRARRADEAVVPLRRAADTTDHRDAAETYLGLAFASLGDLSAAMQHWKRVAASGTDVNMVRIARENLARAEQ